MKIYENHGKIFRIVFDKEASSQAKIFLKSKQGKKHVHQPKIKTQIGFTGY